MNKVAERVILICVGAALVLSFQLATGLGQDIPGTGGLTRYQLAKMLYECDRDSGKPEGYCIADVDIRHGEVRE